MKTIKIYNHAHYGDIFYSRILINALTPHFNIEYYHSQLGLILNDLPNVLEFTYIPKTFDMNLNYVKNGIVNAWIGQNYMSYVENEQRCSFSNHFKLVKNICNELEINLKNPLEYLPYVNYQNLSNINHLEDKMNYYKIKYDKTILICDGNIKSGQSENFDFSSIIIKLANKYKNYLFLSTNNNFNLDNVISTHPNLTSKLPDLLDISYISKFCDVIIGRASGPFCYTQTSENLFNKEKIFISFTHNEFEGNFLEESTCKKIWSNNFILESIYDTIDSNLKF
jgi:hypothetical protein